MGKLTTHVLDTAHGRPGAGIVIELYRGEAGRRETLGRRVTNADGRCDTPLLEGDAMPAGVYELDFHVGDYFASLGLDIPAPRFIDVVTLRFGISDAGASYHVPLLVSPYGYSTYRGS
ncbi:MAG TPA: hydroxyisourate hydrolase [Candidatus Saccharimonadia bacterium]|nr:hydroxyisourate hydrolase [Candidatus Saccharimonadia bacterium]